MSTSRKTRFKRKFISLETKVHILNRLQNGEKVSIVAKNLNLNEATIRTIRINEMQIRSAVSAGSSISAKYAARPRAPIIEKMEKALGIWIDDCSAKGIPMGGDVIRQKAVKIYELLKQSGESPVRPDFLASKGWLVKFQRRFAIPTVKNQPESPPIDHEAAKRYPEQIQRIIEEHGYTTHQVFNANVTGLAWKSTPKRIFVLKDEKAEGKDRITLLFCSNASGELMTKPLLVYRSFNPRALKGVNKNTLPVHWGANAKSTVTGDLFKYWFFICFVPEVENYLNRKKLNFKVLLLLDHAPGEPQNLSHPNVRIEFLPPNTAPLIQPLDQGIIYTFKIYYIRRSLQWILDTIYSKSIDATDAWYEFSIKTCIDIIALSVEELQRSTLNACWKNIWPSAAESSLESRENEIRGILEIAKSIAGLSFVDIVTVEDVQKLLMDEEIGEADLVEMASDVANQICSDDEGSNEDSEGTSFTRKTLQTGLTLAKNLETFFLTEDPCAERCRKFKRDLENCLAPYREIYNEIARAGKQSETGDFFKREEDAINVKEEMVSESDDDDDDDSGRGKKRFHLIVTDSNHDDDDDDDEEVEEI